MCIALQKLNTVTPINHINGILTPYLLKTFNCQYLLPGKREKGIKWEFPPYGFCSLATLKGLSHLDILASVGNVIKFV